MTIEEIYYNFATELVKQPCSDCKNIIEFDIMPPLFDLWVRCTNCGELIRFDKKGYKDGKYEIVPINRNFKI